MSTFRERAVRSVDYVLSVECLFRQHLGSEFSNSSSLLTCCLYQFSSLPAIYKNVRGVEAELGEFSTTFISDEILPPETAVTEAEHRLKTRLDVLVGQFSGAKK